MSRMSDRPQVGSAQSKREQKNAYMRAWKARKRAEALTEAATPALTTPAPETQGPAPIVAPIAVETRPRIQIAGVQTTNIWDKTPGYTYAEKMRNRIF